MKVGTDAVLLGSYADSGKSGKILDIGTGSGVIALMLAQRSEAVIDAVEIDPESARQAGENFKNSPWKTRMNIICSSFRDFFMIHSIKYNVIVCNPPFFFNSLKSPYPRKSLAKHNDTLGNEELLTGVKKLLAEEGLLYVILPYMESQIFSEKAMAEGLFLNREMLIQPKPGKPVNRVILVFGLSKKEFYSDHITIRLENGNYSDDYKKLTCYYYLDFKN